MHDTHMSKDRLNDMAKDLRSSFFSERETQTEAFKYAYAVIDAMPQDAKAAAYTSLHVVVNTIAREIEAITEEL